MLNTRIKISLVLSSLLFGGLLLACNASEENELPTEEPLVEQTETPQDTDGDGVIDTLDTCPNTPTNVQVDSNGCAVKLLPHKELHHSLRMQKKKLCTV